MTEQKELIRSYLEQIRTNERKINAKALRVAELESRAIYTTTQYGGVGVSHGIENARENLLAKIIDDKTDLINQIAKLEDEKKQALDMLDSIKDEQTYRAMHEHYILGKGWYDVAKAMGKSYQWINRLHNAGLAAIADKYEAHTA